jgi:hypothetical protein
MRWDSSSSTAIDTAMPPFGASVSAVLRDGPNAAGARMDDTISKMRDLVKDLDAKASRHDACASFLTTIGESLRLQRPRDSMLHKFVEAYDSNEPSRRAGLDGDIFAFASEKFWEETKAISQIFLIQHDWKSAMAGADVGDFQLPYPKCCFEFIVSDHRFCALAGVDESSGRRYLLICYQNGATWVTAGPYIVKADGWTFAHKPDDNGLPIVYFIDAHIRALCVSLEAEVAVADTIRAPHKLNARLRATGRHEAYDYRELRLSRKPRPLPLADHTAGTPKRLHFRRGHWRHFGNHKTWVKWCLCGDPDLGFIDKHYRL